MSDSLRESTFLHLKAGVVQLLTVIFGLVQLYIIANYISSDIRIIWLSSQNLLGGLALADLGLSQVFQRFAGYTLSGNRSKYTLRFLLKRAKKFYIIQLVVIGLICILQQKLGAVDFLTIRIYSLLVVLGITILHKNRLGNIINNLRSPLFSRILDLIANVFRILLLVVFSDNISSVLIGWQIILLIQSYCYYSIVKKAKSNEFEDRAVSRDKLFEDNIIRTSLMNLGGFYITYLGGTLILKFGNLLFVESYLMSHRIVIVLFGVCQSFIYISIPSYSRLYNNSDFLNLKKVFKKSFLYSVFSYSLGIILIRILWNLLPLEAPILPNKEFLILSVTFLLELIHINFVTVTLAKPWQPYLKSSLIMITLFTVGYWWAVKYENSTMFLLVPLIGQIIASYSFSTYYYLSNNKWNVFKGI